MDLAQNDETMCHCRVWCRETGQAGGQGGYEKGCPQSNIKYKPSPSFTRQEKEDWKEQDQRPYLCLFHARAERDNGGLNFGFITEERPTHFTDNTPHGFHGRVGQKIPWKCDPPDYNKTHAEHKYRLRDDTCSRDRLRNKYEKILQDKEKTTEYQIKRRELAEQRSRNAERQVSEFVRVAYGMPHYMNMTFDRENKKWKPIDITSASVNQYFNEWRNNLKKFLTAKRWQRRKWGKEEPLFTNSNLNELAYDKIRKVEDFCWETEDQLNERLHQEYDDYDKRVEITCRCRDIVFDMVNSLVQETEERKEVCEVQSVLDEVVHKCVRNN
jgi:hypothetical protein